MILILGGTTEGRAAVKVVDEAGTPYFYSTKENSQQVECLHGKRLSGGMGVDDMANFCLQNNIRLLIDAAHPFAEQLHQTVAEVAIRLSLPVVRYERRYPPRDKSIIWCDNYDDVIQKLEKDGITNLLALTGVHTISKLRLYWEKYPCIFRILERKESIQLANAQGFPMKQLVFYHPEEEEKLFARLQLAAILTKESGESGGFANKVDIAQRLHIAVYAVKRPLLSKAFIVVTGVHGLRKQVEHFVPGFYPLRSGYTTGSCATAAAKAALLALILREKQQEVSFFLPDGEELTLPVSHTDIKNNTATATVIKDAGDDPDVTNGQAIVVTVAYSPYPGIHFLQGKGVGRVTLPGLGLEVGGPAINSIPRQMIINELSALSKKGIDVTITVPGGTEIAKKTFNPKLGVVDGISIIGTSGVVSPFSSQAFIDAIRKEIEVAIAVGTPCLVINSGAKSERFIKKLYPELPPQAFVHYGNFIGDTLKIAAELSIKTVTLGIMIGKAVKLAEGNLDTHSRNVVMNKSFLKQLATEAGCSKAAQMVINNITLARELWTQLNMDDAHRFFPKVIDQCLKHCTPLLPKGEITILLIDEEGHIIGKKKEG
ncbi:MAG: cobalt-precorrin-5B (C(1))-methyltransferase CbiD [Parabacteroides sp.]